MKGDIGGEGGFAHCRAARKDDQVGSMETAHLVVQPSQAGAVTGKAAVTLKRNRRLIDRRRCNVLERPQTGAGFSRFGKLEQLCLSGLDLCGGRKVHIRMAGVADDVVADPDQLAAEMCLIDGGGIVGRLCDADDTVGKFAQIIFDFGRLAFFCRAEERFECHRIRQLSTVYQAHHRRKDAAVERIVEMFCPQPVVDPFHHAIVEQQSAEQILFCGKIVRHLPCGADTDYRARPAGKGFDVACFFGHVGSLANGTGPGAMLVLWRVGITEKITPCYALGYRRQKKPGRTPAFC